MQKAWSGLNGLTLITEVAVKEEYHSKQAEYVPGGHILSFDRLIRRIAIEYILVTIGV